MISISMSTATYFRAQFFVVDPHIATSKYRCPLPSGQIIQATVSTRAVMLQGRAMSMKPLGKQRKQTSWPNVPVQGHFSALGS
jgi:hypothetical protein